MPAQSDNTSEETHIRERLAFIKQDHAFKLAMLAASKAGSENITIGVYKPLALVK